MTVIETFMWPSASQLVEGIMHYTPRLPLRGIHPSREGNGMFPKPRTPNSEFRTPIFARFIAAITDPAFSDVIGVIGEWEFSFEY